MEITAKKDIIAAGSFPRSSLWRRASKDVEAAIGVTDWPHGSGTFSLNTTPILNRKGKPDKHSNGVEPIKLPLMRHLEVCGWVTESLPPIPAGQLLKTGDLDALLTVQGCYVGFECETANVSSSHRAISKLLDALCRGTIAGGILAVPVKATQRYLTDRVGSFEELSPYFGFWGRYPVPSGALRIYGMSHDVIDNSVPHIPKGTDGRALG